MGLAPETLQLIKEAFGHQECQFCKAPASRMYRKLYYCIDCFPIKRKNRKYVIIPEIHDNRRIRSIQED